jgi:two-component system, cell cycle sensor histidine kinase and response regulator CckA
VPDPSDPPPEPPFQGGGQPSRPEKERALLESAQQRQILDAVARLAGSVAHDLNNILTAINGYCELLLLRYGDEQPLRADLGEIQTAAARAGDLSRHLLAYSRRPPSHPEPLPLAAVVREMEEKLRQTLGQGFDLALELVADGPTAVVDRNLLEAVVVGLVERAREAMVDGGTVTLSTGVREIPESLRTKDPGVSAGRWATLTVTDSGKPPDLELGSRLFEPSFSIKDPDPVATLRLAMAFRGAQHCGGLMVVEGGEEATAITLLLPTASEGGS